MQIYPLKFRPIFKTRIWGGQKLKTFLGKDIPSGSKIGESWELTDLPDNRSVIVNGEFAGQTIDSVIARYPKEVMGDKNFSGQFPLLIKFLDAEDILSVQVHPDQKICKKLGKGEPKTECWYIVAARPGAVIYKGLKENVDRTKFGDAIKAGCVAEFLNEVPVKTGECHFLPAGTVHSRGAGLLIAEIQTPSDTTYRVFDWNRVDEYGKARRLHVEEALESIDFDITKEDLPVTTKGRLVECGFFRIDKSFQARASEMLYSPGKFSILIFLSGLGVMTGGVTVNFGMGDTILVPAGYNGVIKFADNTEYLTVTR